MRNCDIWMSVNFYVFMQRFEMFLDMLRIIVDQQRRLHETNDENLHTSLSQLRQYTIESKLWVIDISRPLQHEIWCNHPACDAYLFFSFHQLVIQIFIISTSVTVQFSIWILSLLWIAVKSVLPIHSRVSYISMPIAQLIFWQLSIKINSH